MSKQGQLFSSYRLPLHVPCPTHPAAPRSAKLKPKPVIDDSERLYKGKRKEESPTKAAAPYVVRGCHCHLLLLAPAVACCPPTKAAAPCVRPQLHMARAHRHPPLC